MSGYHLCQVKKAGNPYYIASTGLRIYTIEELCFYLQTNIYLIDKTIINRKLCEWLDMELGLTKLSRKLLEQLNEDGVGIGNFIMPIFKEINYLSPAAARKIAEQISRVEIQPEDLRHKMKADHLVSYEMYQNAIREYYLILKERSPGNMGIQFYAAVLNNMAVAYARLFLFEEAADCLWQSYSMVRSGRTWRRYLSVLPLYMSREQYQDRLKELHVPAEQIAEIEAANAACRESARREMAENLTPEVFQAEMKKQYYKSMSG